MENPKYTAELDKVICILFKMGKVELESMPLCRKEAMREYIRNEH
jgi:hypothetical protein